MPRSLRPCSTPGCDEVTTERRCPLHASRARRDSQEARRGYKQAGHTKRFRPGVLAKDPTCVWPGCTEPSTVADHWPLTRKQLLARGMDPDDPRHGRGLCASHHGLHTAMTNPAGWAER